MKTKIEFIHLPNSEAAAEFVAKRLQTVSRRLQARANRSAASEIHVRLIGSAYSPEGKVKEVEAEVLIVIPNRRSIAVRKKGTNVQKAFHEAITSSEKILQRESEKREHSRTTVGKTRRLIRTVVRGKV